MSGNTADSNVRYSRDKPNVRAKLQAARLALKSDPSYQVNVTALEKAQPKDLDASEIDVRLGATWVDREYIQQFMQETFETPFYMRRNIEVKFSPLTAEWQITGKTVPNRHDVAAYVTYGTDRANAYRILAELDAALNMEGGGAVELEADEPSEGRPSVLADLKQKSSQVPPPRRDTTQRTEEVL